MKITFMIASALIMGMILTACDGAQTGASGAAGAASAPTGGAIEAAVSSGSGRDDTQPAGEAASDTQHISYALGKIKDEKLAEAGFKPYGITFGSDGSLYAAVSGQEIVKITADGKVHSFFKTDETNSAPGSTYIWCIRCGPDGCIYAPAGDRLLKITPDGKATTLIEDPEVFPQGVEFDQDKNIYVTSGLKVFKYTPSLQKSVFIDGRVSIKQLIFIDIRFDADYKNLYITNYAYQEMYKYPIKSDGTAGEGTVVFDSKTLGDRLEGQRPDWYSKAPTAHASWFAMDDAGNMYVSVEDISCILKIGTDNSYTLYEIDNPFFNSTIAMGKGEFDKNALYTTGYDDGYIHKLTFLQ